MALSAGVFQDVVLTRLRTARVRADGFEVLTHHRVPTNNAGVSVGQVGGAAALVRELGRCTSAGGRERGLRAGGG